MMGQFPTAAPGMTSLLIIAFLGIIPILVQANTHFHDFVLKEKNFTRLCNTKSMLVVNESFPGPTIYVNKGDIVYVNVHNQGGYGVTIHWHGVKQPRNPWSDGPEFVTQCAIEPGKNFTYEVVFSEEEGTLWWHAHSNWTRNSVYGAIVIYPEEGTTYPYPKHDIEEILMLGSWYNYDVNLVVEQDLIEGLDLPDSYAYLINGQPGDFSNCSANSTYRFMVDSGKTYLLRIVNGIMNAEIFFGISSHNMTVVGTDGAYLKPFSTSYIMIGPGQTMDVLITTDQAPSEYYMSFHRFYTGLYGFDTYDKTNATSILEYVGNYTQLAAPSFPDLPSYTSFDHGIEFNRQLRSLNSEEHPATVPMNITTRMFVTAALNKYNDSSLQDVGNAIPLYLDSSMNNVTWINPTVDILQAYHRNISGFYTEDFPDQPPALFDFISADPVGIGSIALQGTKVKVVEYGEEIEVIFQNVNFHNASEDHPMHLHGHSFYVVGFGVGEFDNETDLSSYNLVDPPYVNTASLPKNGWLTVRFKANNPGVWLWHCHLDRHLSWGMNTVLIVKNGGTPDSTMRDPPPNMPSCKPSTSSLPLYKRTSEGTKRLSNI